MEINTNEQVTSETSEDNNLVDDTFDCLKLICLTMIALAIIIGIIVNTDTYLKLPAKSIQLVNVTNYVGVPYLVYTNR